MFPGIPFNEFPLSTSEEMTLTFNGDIQEQKVYINREEPIQIYIDQQVEHDVYIDQQVSFDLEN
jgi:hypothetical protein